jgi:hypothetical protein
MNVFPVNNGNVLTIKRMNEDDLIVIVFNFNKEKMDYQLPVKGAFRKVFDSSAAEWKGPGEVTPCVIQGEESFSVNPMSALIFEPHKD